MNKMYKKAVAVRRQKQSKINSQVKAAMRGLPSHTAKLTFDLTDRDTNKRLDVPHNARIKAISIVSDLLDSFGLPSKAKLEYLGTVKKATTKDGTIKDGILKVGATISTLLGHRIAIDVPVIVRDKSLLEPAVFFYDGSPYVLCKQAIDQLVKRGTLDKAVAERKNMYSPPLMEKWLGIDHEQPRSPIINRDHMFNPGSRNPWKFRRYSQKTPSTSEQECPACEGEGKSPSGNRRGPREDWMEPCPVCYGSGTIESQESSESDSDVEGARLSPYTEEKCEQCGYSMPTNEAGCRQCGAPRTTRRPLEQAFESKSKERPEFEVNEGTPVLELNAQKKTDKKDRERINIDTPTEFPKVWKGDVKDQVLDPAERNHEELFGVGEEVKLNEDFEARERGGGQIIVPSGERGKIIRDVQGDGLCLMVNFPDMDMSAIVPRRFLKSAQEDKHPFDRQATIHGGYVVNLEVDGAEDVITELLSLGITKAKSVDGAFLIPGHDEAEMWKIAKDWFDNNEGSSFFDGEKDLQTAFQKAQIVNLNDYVGDKEESGMPDYLEPVADAIPGLRSLYKKKSSMAAGVYSIVLPDFPETGWTLFVDPEGHAVLQQTDGSGADILAVYSGTTHVDPVDVIDAAIASGKDEMLESITDMQRCINDSGIKYDLESEFNEQIKLHEQEYGEPDEEYEQNGDDKQGISETELENPYVTSGEPLGPETTQKCKWCLSQMDEPAGVAQGEPICQKCLEFAKEHPEECEPEQLKDLGISKSAATIDQIKHEIRIMFREGYCRTDIVAAVKERYPEHAAEVLKNLD